MLVSIAGSAAALSVIGSLKLGKDQLGAAPPPLHDDFLEAISAATTSAAPKFLPPLKFQGEEEATARVYDLSLPLGARAETGAGSVTTSINVGAGLATGRTATSARRAEFAGLIFQSIDGQLRVGPNSLSDYSSMSVFVSSDHRYPGAGGLASQARGPSFRNPLKVADNEVGVAWQSGRSQARIGMIQHKLAYNDFTGNRDVSDHASYAAVSFVLRR